MKQKIELYGLETNDALQKSVDSILADSWVTMTEFYLHMGAATSFENHDGGKDIINEQTTAMTKVGITVKQIFEPLWSCCRQITSGKKLKAD